MDKCILKTTYCVFIHQLKGIWVVSTLGILLQVLCVCVWIYVFISLGHILRSGIAGSSGNPVVNFLGSVHTVLHTGCTTLHAHRPCVRVPVSPQFLAHTFCLSACSHLDGCEVVSLGFGLCISLVADDTEHLCMFFLFLNS